MPGSLILKTGNPDRPGTEWAHGSREVAFYTDVAPLLTSGLVPRCFAARQADAAIPRHVVLEDLTETHTVATEWPLPPTDTQCKTIIGSLARLHAAWWDDPRTGVTIGTKLDDAGMDWFIRQVATHLEVFANRLGDELSADRRAFYERLITAAPRLHERYRDAPAYYAHAW